MYGEEPIAMSRELADALDDSDFVEAVRARAITSTADARELIRLVAERLHAKQAPAGWKLVPVEPTDEMAAACTRVLEAEDAPDAWAAMLAAAPEAP